MRYNELIIRVSEEDTLENPTEEEIIGLWRSLKSGGLPEEEAWHAIVTGMALDMAFARSKKLKLIVH